MSWFGRKAHPKDEHPMQEARDNEEVWLEWDGREGIVHRGGQSNRALLTLMKKVEARIALNHEVETAEKRTQVIRMMQAGLSYSEYYMAPVAQLADEWGGSAMSETMFTQLEQDEAKCELQSLLAAYDCSVLFPEFAEQYMQEHPSRYDFSAIAQCIIPPEDPRRKKHDGKLGSHDDMYLVQYMLKQRPCYASVWIGRDTELRHDEIWLSPEQALSLLAWLQQEQETLVQMTKGRENER